MNPYTAYYAADAKISAKKGKVLDEARLRGMMECETVDQVADYIKNKYGLAGLIYDAGSNTRLFRDDLEQLMTRYMVRETEEMLHYFSGPYRDFLRVFLMRFEITDLVMMLRKITRNEVLTDVSERFVHSGSYSKLPFDKLAASKGMEEFIENLRGTPYYTALKTVTGNDDVKREFHSEMKLQILFYKTLMKRAAKLEKKDSEAVKEIVGTRIDFLNVQWIYRAKAYYDISEEQILVYCIQGGNRLKLNILKKLVYSKTMDELAQMSNKYMNYRIFGNESDIKKNLDNGFYSYLDGRKNDKSIGKVLWYLYMLDKAIKNLVTVTEGIRYRLPREQMEMYLIYKEKKKGVVH